MRFFLHLAYNGTGYAGWQKQPDATTVQGFLEEALSKLFATSIELTGCGRTDAGVHAEDFYAHFDAAKTIPRLAYKLNRLLPPDIVINDVRRVADDRHARFDATSRSYIYRLIPAKDPFRYQWKTVYPRFEELDVRKMQQAARLLLNYEDFFTFCKTGADNKTTICKLTQSEWIFLAEKNELQYHISADRFLRGMVRLIVGMSLNVGLGNISIEEVREALEQRRRLKRPLSAPPQGLSLVKVEYNS